jgi:hypothetical protein
VAQHLDPVHRSGNVRQPREPLTPPGGRSCKICKLLWFQSHSSKNIHIYI